MSNKPLKPVAPVAPCTLYRKAGVLIESAFAAGQEECNSMLADGWVASPELCGVAE